MSRLIGLTGYAGAGKDEVAKILVREHGFVRVAFADPLREMLYALNPRVFADAEVCVRLRDMVDVLGWEQAKRNHAEIRELLQRVGTEAGRNVLGEGVWVDLGMRRARETGGSVVFTDVRFENEALAVAAAGGEVWRVERPGVGAVNGHISDTAQAGIAVNKTILNWGSLADLGPRVFAAVTA